MHQSRRNPPPILSTRPLLRLRSTGCASSLYERQALKMPKSPVTPMRKALVCETPVCGSYSYGSFGR
ncbi:hypothetical protein IG631_20221 [Alternaria alternata]|nr:hypothetical protein IG631_20221 [Alternaria alternata]